MAVKKYSKKTQGDTQISKNFKLREFACKDGSDEILLDDLTLGYVQKIRDHFNAGVTIVSAYRTPDIKDSTGKVIKIGYNTKVGGAKDSYHVKGQACDIQVSGVNPREVAKYAESIGVPGIGLYDYADGSGFVHVDSRGSKYYWVQKTRNGGAVGVSTHGGAPVTTTSGKPTLRKGDKGVWVKELQIALNKIGTSPKIAEDSDFGAKTDAAVKAFQSSKNLTIDGVVGAKTWLALGI